MVEIKSAAFVLQQQNFLEALARAATGEGPWPYNIVGLVSVRIEPELTIRIAPLRAIVPFPNCNPW